MMKKILIWFGRIVLGLGCLAVSVLMVEFGIFRHFESGPAAISSARALELVNTCQDFTHAESGTLRAIATSHVWKGTGGSDASSYVSGLSFTWREMAAERSGNGEASFKWFGAPELRNWKFPESEWRVTGFRLEGEKNFRSCEISETP